MNISRAMKKVARIQGEIKELQLRMQNCVSTLEENDYEADFKQLWEEWCKKIIELIDIKSRIMKVNNDKNKFIDILTLGETKGKLKFIKDLDVKMGTDSERYSGIKNKYKSQITSADKQNFITEFQTQINNLTDGLDDFNATNSI